MACGSEYTGGPPVRYPLSFEQAEQIDIGGSVDGWLDQPDGYSFLTIGVEAKGGGYLEIQSLALEEGELIQLYSLPCGPTTRREKISVSITRTDMREITTSLRSSLSARLSSSLSSRVAGRVSNTNVIGVGLNETKLSDTLFAELMAEVSGSLNTELAASTEDAISERALSQLITEVRHEVEVILNNPYPCYRKDLYFYQMYHRYRLRLVLTNIEIRVYVVHRRKEGPLLNVYTLFDRTFRLAPGIDEVELGSAEFLVPMPDPCPHTFLKFEPGCCPEGAHDDEQPGTHGPSEEGRLEAPRSPFGFTQPKTGIAPPSVGHVRIADLKPGARARAAIAETVGSLNGRQGKDGAATYDVSTLKRYLAELRSPGGALAGVPHFLDQWVYDLVSAGFTSRPPAPQSPVHAKAGPSETGKRRRSRRQRESKK